MTHPFYLLKSIVIGKTGPYLFIYLLFIWYRISTKICSIVHHYETYLTYRGSSLLRKHDMRILEARSRCNNLRITRIKERQEDGKRTMEFITQCLKDMHGLDKPVLLDRVPGTRQEPSPSDAISTRRRRKY